MSDTGCLCKTIGQHYKVKDIRGDPESGEVDGARTRDPRRDRPIL